MDKDIIAAFTSEKAVALRPIEPLDCTDDTLRHFASLWQTKKIWRVLIGLASERLNGAKTKRLTDDP